MGDGVCPCRLDADRDKKSAQSLWDGADVVLTGYSLYFRLSMKKFVMLV